MAHIPLPYLLATAAGLSTLAGGILALRLHDRMPLLPALTSGFVIGLALFDLLPEALAHDSWPGGASSIAARTGLVLGAALVGFALYALAHRLPATRQLGAATLLMHSVMDGLGIGLAFHIDHATGWLVAAAVLAHDMADGANVVALVRGRATGHGHPPGDGVTLASQRSRLSRILLVADALAPLLGVTLARALHISTSDFAFGLAVFAGGFVYLGTCELFPRALLHPGQSRRAPVVTAVAGLAIMATVVHFAH